MSTFIICHDQLPNYTPPNDSKIIWLSKNPLSESRGMEVIPGYDYFDNAEAIHKKLSGAFGGLVISKIAEEIKTDSQDITIWQYRKFVTVKKLGSPSKQYPGMYVLQENQEEKIDVSNELEDINDFLLPAPVNLKNLYLQYSISHNIVDLLRYTSLAVELNVMTPKESFDFINLGHLIPGGVELGSYPLAWWKTTFPKIASVSAEFITRYTPYQADDPYQCRAVAFCQERLGSYFLIKHLTMQYHNEIPTSLFGTMHTVTADGIYRTGT